MSVNLLRIINDIIIEYGAQAAAEKFGCSVQTIKNWEIGKSMPGLHACQIAIDEFQSKAPIVREEHKINETEPYTWEGKNVCFLLPCYDGIRLETHDTLFRNYSRYGASKVGLLCERGSLIEDARNALATRFVTETKCEWAIFVDHDMVLPHGANVWGMDLPEGLYRPILSGSYFVPIENPWSARYILAAIHRVRPNTPKRSSRTQKIKTPTR